MALSQTWISYALLLNGSFKGLGSDYSGFPISTPKMAAIELISSLYLKMV